mgnify:CR=1 FL=1
MFLFSYVSHTVSNMIKNMLYGVKWQLMEYAHLLDLADECEDPYLKLAYACKLNAVHS